AAGTTIGTLGSTPSNDDESDSAVLTFKAGSRDLTVFSFVDANQIQVLNEANSPISGISWSVDADLNLVGKIGDTTVVVLHVEGPAVGIAAATSGVVTVKATLTDAFPHAQGDNQINITGIKVQAADVTGVTKTTGTVGATVLDDA